MHLPGARGRISYVFVGGASGRAKMQDFGALSGSWGAIARTGIRKSCVFGNEGSGCP